MHLILTDIASSIYSAIHTDLRPLQYVYQTPEQYKSGKSGTPKTRRPKLRDISRFSAFDQMWGSTALGFGGIGCRAMTTAMTVCVEGPSQDWCVYFGGRFAYRIDAANGEFFEDMAKRFMVDVSSAKKRYERKKEVEA